MAGSEDRHAVYRTGIGRIPVCKRCGQPEAACRCASGGATGGSREAAPHDGYVRVSRDRKGRGGKTMTLLNGVPGSEAELAALAQRLKRLCGSGGTAKDGIIEIQGDHRDKIEAELKQMGHKVKRVGG
jgi:translation initiation factor 1